ncbi:hypothetical protein CJD36_004535 [Flavipsychrobacter stenotrophus]|uniref:Type IV secretion system coupling protein TraD DNA-binding domain-containing protein n=1 Tax=Flavipsychrobacter stenotrophus TaxID=2077091 RepID=A0A2S7T2N0_9BACT|nr:type IV secretory system conjugative DNA transfer family protein [Flavipsychrobacter stenotrophus]PQJ13016.1 hypothetical protein CJD36_004535 [Flavipsychrobacter stenotrophus]
MSIIENILTATIEGVFDFIKGILFRERPTEYSAEFGTPGSQLQKEPGGFRIGFQWGNSLLESNSHMITFGGSGSKKSSCVCFNTLLQSHNSSYVVFDCSGELYNGTASHKSRSGYSVYKLDLDDYKQSIGFNWLSKCTSESDIYKFAQVTLKNSLEGAPYDYWAQSAENLIGFFAYSLFAYASAEFVNMPNVLNMIQVFSFAPGKIDQWIAANGNERIINRYKSIVATPDKTLQSSIATATNALAVYNNPNIAAITSRDTLAFDEFRKQKTILYLCGSPSTVQFCRGVSACFFESFFAHILQRLPGTSDLPITFIIDEAATMRLQSLPKILELGRKYLISVATLWQDFGQVEHIFGKNEAANILANSRLKVFMPSGQPLATCRMLSELLGKYSYEDKNSVLKTRELLTAQEIFQLREILLLNGNNKPMLLAAKPYFENKKLKEITELPVYTIPNPVQLTQPSFLQF